jgi:hypothetical protein
VCVVNDQQDGIAGIATIDQELVGDGPQLARRTSNIPESKLSQKRKVKFLFVGAGFVDCCVRNVIAKIRNVTIQQRGFSRSIGTANDDQAVGLFRRNGQMSRQQGILLGVKDLGRSSKARKRSLRESEEFEIRWIRSRVL